MKSFLKFFLIAAVFTTVAISDSTSFTIHIAGDSTVCNYKESAYPQTGWGQVLGHFFDGSRVKINNAAIGGRSSRTFIEEGRLDALLASAQKGDYLLVQFGHNDRDYSKPARYVEPSQFPGYIQQYIDAGKNKGVHVILVSPMNLNGSRNVFSTGDRNYDARGMMQTLAQKNQIPFVDLNMKSYNTYNVTYKSMPDYVTRYLYKSLQSGEYPNYPDGVNDGTTHFQEMGSMGHSQMICEELEENLKNNSNLSTEAKAALSTLVSAMNKRYTISVKTNLTNYSGLITQTQNFPAGSPMTLRVTPNTEVFEKWVDDDCNEISKELIYYNFKTPARNITYTAMFKGGAACEKISHEEEESEIISSSSSTISSSSSGVSINPDLCFNGIADAKWPSPIDMSMPEVSDGTTDTNHTGFTGKGFYNFTNSLTSKATYNITSDQSASNARVMLRYAFDGVSNRDMKVTIDNGTYDVLFPPTGAWDKWDTVYIENVWVDALDFKVTFASTTENGGPNIDMIAFDIKGVYRTGCSPAKVENDISDSPQSIGIRKSQVPMQKNKGRLFNTLGRTVDQYGNTSKLPKGHYFSK